MVGYVGLPGDGIVDDRTVDVLGQGFESLHGGHCACLDGFVDDLTKDAEHRSKSIAQRPCSSRRIDSRVCQRKMVVMVVVVVVG